VSRPDDDPAEPRADAARMPWPTVLVFASAGFLTMTASLMTAGLLPAMAGDFSVSDGLAGTLTSVFALAIVLTVLPGTRLTLRWSRRAVIVTTVVMLILSNLIVAAAPSLAVALVGRFVGGTAHGLLVSAMPAVLMRIVPRHDVPKAMGIALAGNSAGLAAGAPLTAVLASAVGWRGSFVIAAGAGVVIALALWLVVPSIRVDAVQAGSIRRTVRTPGVLRMSVSWALVLLGHYAVLTFIAPLFLDLGGSAESVGLPLLVVGLTGMAGVLLAGRLPLRAVLWGAICSAGLVATSFALLWMHPPMAVVYTLFALWGAGSAAALLLNQQCVLLAGHRAPELAMSLGVLVTQFGVALGASAGGITLHAYGPQAVPLTGAAVIALALLLLIGMPRILRSAQSERQGPAPSG
jgi:DHA1 family purine ribonucleoside efflux pump-like MFS transporter